MAKRTTTDYRQERAYLDLYKITPNCLVTWYTIIDYNQTKHNSFFAPGIPKEKTITYQGEITPHSRRRLHKAIQLLIEITKPRFIYNPVSNKRIKFHLAFWTLTLSAPQYFIPDSTIKKEVLEPFLRKMRRHGLRNYIWKAEIQNNGNIHFHLLTDLFLEYTIIRDTWNNCQQRLGLITEFEKKHGHRIPNSTDVKQVKNSNMLAKYLAKYLLKKADKTKQQKLSSDIDPQRKGKIWDCSLNLKIKNKAYDQLTNELFSHLQHLEQTGKIRTLRDDFFKLYFISKSDRNKLIPSKYLKSYQEYISKVTTYNETIKIQPFKSNDPPSTG